MLFNSFEFLIFGPLVLILYWVISQRGGLKARNVFLLLASYVFYGWWDWRFLILIILSSCLDYAVGLKIHQAETRKVARRWLQLSILFNIGMLGVFKYFNFFAENLSTAFSSVGVTLDSLTLDVILPVGISFYTFQTLSYSIDVYRQKMSPSKDPVAFLTYVAFFPQLVAGPIERAINLLPQFERSKAFDYAQAVEGMRLVLWGLFKKIVIADNCAVVVDTVFAGYADMSGVELIVGVVFFAFQIYGDFSGYSDIAIGLAKTMGFNLMTNFRTPYFARSISEFWRRWHISLSTWFRDYVYIPLGGSKVNRTKVIRNVLVIFLVSGFWHGANWTFIVWGALHALFFLPGLLFKLNRRHLDGVAHGRWLPTPLEGLQMLTTFTLVCVAWVFFRAESVGEATDYLLSIVRGAFMYQGDFNLFSKTLLLIIGGWVVIEWLLRDKGISQLVDRLPRGWMRLGVYQLIIVTIILFGNFGDNDFIYFQF